MAVPAPETIEKLRALFQPYPAGECGPSDEPESSYRFGYNTALEDVLDALGVSQD